MMNPGPVEEAGRTARGIIKALRGQPGILALVVFQTITFGAVGWSVHQRAEDMQEERKMFAAERSLFIDKCVIPIPGNVPLTMR
jgi:hypothetical protein